MKNRKRIRYQNKENKKFVNPVLLILDYPFVCYYNWFMNRKGTDKRYNNGAFFSFIGYISGLFAAGALLLDTLPWLALLLMAIYLLLRFYVFGRVAQISETYKKLNPLLKKCLDVYALLLQLALLIYIIRMNFQIFL